MLFVCGFDIQHDQGQLNFHELVILIKTLGNFGDFTSDQQVCCDHISLSRVAIGDHDVEADVQHIAIGCNLQGFELTLQKLDAAGIALVATLNAMGLVALSVERFFLLGRGVRHPTDASHQSSSKNDAHVGPFVFSAIESHNV